MNIKKEKNNKGEEELVLRVPLLQKESNCYKDDWDLLDVPNLMGVENGDDWDNTISFANDMSYAGKEQQEGSPIIHFDDREEFEKVCKEFGLDIAIHDKCSRCHKTIYGCFTMDGKGIVCMDCEEDKKESLEEKIRSAKDSLIREVKDICTDEIYLAHTTKSGKTSRLTSLFMRVCELQKKNEKKE